MKAMAEEELAELKQHPARSRTPLAIALLPRDEADSQARHARNPRRHRGR
jgi:protein subunit release factor A